MKIVHCYPNMVTNDPRVIRARDSWELIHESHGWINAAMPLPYPRSSMTIGDNRDCCYLKDVLQFALSKTISPEDVILYTDDDLILNSVIDGAIRKLVFQCSMFTGQRIELDSFDEANACADLNSGHLGRSLVGFVAGQLDLDKIPDFIIGPSTPDLCLTAMARKLAGKEWSIHNASTHEPACELPLGCVFHERHISYWRDHEGKTPGEKHNRELTVKWFLENMPDSLPQHLK